ncbi:MAG: hypothetical protein JWO06_1438, partial [Bacteroidota bacterium]|nr:hypothetical protein [Bacteroidota bacterium]
LTINIGTGNTTLSSSLAISDTLNLQSGTLVSGNNFTLLGTLTGNGNIYTTSSAKVSINTAGGIGGALNFASGSVANKLIVDIGFGNAVTISGPLNVLDTLKLVTGTLNIGNGSLTISGEISGIGNLAGTTSSDLMINTSADVELDFAAGGQTLNNLIVNTGAGNSVTLGTSLTITGVLSLANQNSLDISGESLTLSGDLTGSGLLTVNTGTTLIINGPNGLSTPVVLSGIIGTFILNTGSSDSVVLGSDLNVSNLISLQNGILVLHGNDLGITGDIASGGNGTISSNSLSNVMINTTGALSGGLAFTGGSITVNNFSLHTLGNLVVAGSFNVDSVLTLNGGKIDIGSDTVFVAAGGYVSGGDSSSYVIATNGGALSLHLDTAYTGWLGFAIGTQANYAPVSAQLNAGSVSADFYASVNSGVDSMGMGGTNISATQPVVDLTWLVEPSVASGVSINLITTWSSSVEVNGFHRDSAYISHYTNAQWDLSATSPAIAATGTYYFSQRNSITSFSPFAVFEKRNNITTAIEANVNDVFLVYPNPASDNLIIKNTADTRGVNVDIINVTGQVMGRYTLTDLTTNVSLTGLTAGDYFVKIYNNNMSVVKPFIKM